MTTGHDHLTTKLRKFWEREAVSLSAFDSLSLIDWCHTYIEDLSMFGISDIYLQNGFNNLCNAYSRKIHA